VVPAPAKLASTTHTPKGKAIVGWPNTTKGSDTDAFWANTIPMLPNNPNPNTQRPAAMPYLPDLDTVVAIFVAKTTIGL